MQGDTVSLQGHQTRHTLHGAYALSANRSTPRPTPNVRLGKPRRSRRGGCHRSSYSGSKAKAHPFRGVDEADNPAASPVASLSRSFITGDTVCMTTPRRISRPDKRIISGFGPRYVQKNPFRAASCGFRHTVTLNPHTGDRSNGGLAPPGVRSCRPGYKPETPNLAVRCRGNPTPEGVGGGQVCGSPVGCPGRRRSRTTN